MDVYEFVIDFSNGTSVTVDTSLIIYSSQIRNKFYANNLIDAWYALTSIPIYSYTWTDLGAGDYLATLRDICIAITKDTGEIHHKHFPISGGLAPVEIEGETYYTNGYPRLLFYSPGDPPSGSLNSDARIEVVGAPFYNVFA